MRILIANHHRTLVGGIETYLGAVMSRLAALGHELLFVHEAPAAPESEPIPIPSNARALELSKVSLEKLRDWKPDIAFLHALHDLDFQQSLIGTFPTVAFAHGYYGLCISGSKTWRRPEPQPCAKKFDWKCLLHFHGKQCGGSSPITMLRDFRRQSRQLNLLRRCDNVITHPGQMQREYETHGIKVQALPHFVAPPTVAPKSKPFAATPTLIYVGRFDYLKGGQILLEALPLLKRPVRQIMVGDGPAKSAWKKQAGDLNVEFPGWLRASEKDALLREGDLIVIPSLWPEPFGQIGLEANQLGIPAVAFDSGGIANWLRDGVNGHLAPANPPTAARLADAIGKALENDGHYAKLRAGALQVASEFSIDKHIVALMAVFEKVQQLRR